MTKTISVKELRMNFPKVRKELEKGVIFTVIYRSSPIAVLSPIETYSSPFEKEIDDKKYDLPKDFKDFIDNIDKYAFKGGKPFDPVKLIRKDRGYDD